MTDALHYDAEVFSECDLTSVGVYKYAEHPSTELLCLSYRFGKGPITLWIPRDSVPDEIIRTVYKRLAEKASVAAGRTAPASILTETRIVVSSDVPVDLRAWLEAKKPTRAHNQQYERVVLNKAAGDKVDFPHVDIEQSMCVAAKAAAAGLPRALGDVCDALETYPKDDSGRISMLQVTKPRKPTKDDPSTRWTPENAPDKFIDLYVYNVDDVLAECGVDDAVPDLPSYERDVYHLDQRINERGIAIDLEAIANVKALIEEYKGFLEAAMKKATEPGPLDICATCAGRGYVDRLCRKKPKQYKCEDCPTELRPSQGAKIADWIRAHGYPDLLDMQAETVKLLVQRDDVPDNVKHVLRIYSTYNAKAVTKFDSLLEAVCADGRVHGMFLYHGANTGRWSSLIVQLQNLFKPVIDDPETAIEAFRTRNLEWIKALYADKDPMKVFASTVRGHFIAGKGKKFYNFDYSGIESRMNAWMWNEEWKLQAFRDFDAGKGPDQYKIAYANVFGIAPKDVNKKQRNHGKVIDLFGQYEGGVGAFVNLADQYGVNLEELAEALWPVLPEDVLDSAAWMWNKFGRHMELPERTYMACDGAKQLWRRSHPNTVDGWVELKKAAELAVQFPGTVYSVANGKAFFKVQEGPCGHTWLCMLLPAKQRMLRYFKPEWTPPKTVVVVEKNKYTGEMQEVEKVVPGELHYMGVDTDTRRYMRTSSYGGSWNNNLIQGSCADILRGGMFACEEKGYPSVLTVHDENHMEVDEVFGSLAEVNDLMCARRPWFDGLPLVAEGWEGRRYRK